MAICQNSNLTTQKFVSLLLIIALLCGCSTITPVAPERETIIQTIQPGDKVRLITRDGLKEKFIVEEVTESALQGDNIVVQIDDIETIEIVVLSEAKTAGLIVGISVTVLVIGTVLAAYASAIGGTNP